MAKLVFTNGHVSIAANDLSGRGSEVEIPYEADAVESTTFGATPDRSHEGGLRKWNATVTLAQDYAVGNVDAILFPLVGTTVAVEFRPVNAVRTTSNPGYQGNAVVTGYQPIAGRVGELMRTRLTLVGSGALVRAVA